MILTAPPWISSIAIERFVRGHSSWIDRSVRRMRNFKPFPVSGRRAYLKHKEEARGFITERVEYWNREYGFRYGRIAIKNTKRLWGSCSRKGNLNFSYALLFLPCELVDYVIVHELCHLKEHNHSPRFWTLVSQTLANYQTRRGELRKYLPR